MALLEVLASLEARYLDLAQGNSDIDTTVALRQANVYKRALDMSRQVVTAYGLRLPSLGELLKISQITDSLSQTTDGVNGHTGVVVDITAGTHSTGGFLQGSDIDMEITDFTIEGDAARKPDLRAAAIYFPQNGDANEPAEPKPLPDLGIVITAATASLSGIDKLDYTPAVNALFDRLFQQFEQPIYQYVYRLLGDAEDARDFTQDAFVKAFKKLPETLLKGDFQPQGWLYRVATNVCFDELRHRKLLKWQPWEAFISLFHPSQISRENPERDALQLETRSEVEKVLGKLSPRYRTALVLREYHRLSYEEIADVLNTSRTATKMLLFRARESFRFHYTKVHPLLAADAKGPRVLPRVLGRPADVDI